MPGEGKSDKAGAHDKPQNGPETPDYSTEDLGYDYFPSRSGTVSNEPEPPGYKRWLSKAYDVVSGNAYTRTLRSRACQDHVIRCVEENHMVKLLINALKKKGCDFKLDRHVSCEPCEGFTNGGYDGINKQVVICANNTRKKNTVCNVLAHELIHAFDDCRANLDMSNIDHVACTEIRAANIMHCHILTAMGQSMATPWGKKQQQDCVRWKARNSVLAVRDVTREQAEDAVDRVFDRCYPDLEPVGRIPRNPYLDGRRIYVEASLYGYTEIPRDSPGSNTF